LNPQDFFGPTLQKKYPEYVELYFAELKIMARFSLKEEGENIFTTNVAVKKEDTIVCFDQELNNSKNLTAKQY
jgi:hypothetical protein